MFRHVKVKNILPNKNQQRISLDFSVKTKEHTHALLYAGKLRENGAICPYLETRAWNNKFNLWEGRGGEGREIPTQSSLGFS